jgi:DNA-binding MarR family transcriptional regulator
MVPGPCVVAGTIVDKRDVAEPVIVRAVKLPRGVTEHDLLDAWQHLIEAHVRIEARVAAAIQETDGLTMPEVELLMRLRKAPEPHELPSTQLAREVSFSSGGLTKLADRLVQAGLVERRAVPGDRRVVLIGFTNKGAEIVERVADTLVEMLARLLLDVLAPEQLGALSDQLRQLRDRATD